MYPISPLIVIAAVLTLFPYLAAGFFPARFVATVRSLPIVVRLPLPALLCIPYLLVTVDRGVFSARWLALYAILPVAMAGLMAFSRSPLSAGFLLRAPFGRPLGFPDLPGLNCVTAGGLP